MCNWFTVIVKNTLVRYVVLQDNCKIGLKGFVYTEKIKI